MNLEDDRMDHDFLYKRNTIDSAEVDIDYLNSESHNLRSYKSFQYSREVIFNPQFQEKKSTNNGKNSKNASSITNKINTHTNVRNSFKILLLDHCRISIIFWIVICVLDLWYSAKFTTTMPLIGLITFNTIIHMIRYYKRQQRDKNINQKTDMEVADFTPEGTKFHHGRKLLQDLEAGDVLRFQPQKAKTGSVVAPADLLLLGVQCQCHRPPETCGSCFLSVTSLTGEMHDLHERHAPEKTARKVLPVDLTYSARITYPEPNDQLLLFEGTMEEKIGSDYGEAIPLSSSNFIPKGTEITNAVTVVAVVVYIGKETKIGQTMQAQEIRKRPIIDHTIDNYLWRFIIVILSVSIVLGVISALSQYHPIDVKEDINFFWFFHFWLNEFQPIIPISMFVTIEICRIVLSHFISWDSKLNMKMGSQKVISSKLVDEIGKITHILLDKTGTITENQLTLKSLSFGGQEMSTVKHTKQIQSLLSDADMKGHKELEDLLIAMAVCTSITVSPDQENFSGDSIIDYALAKSVSELGYKIIKKDSYEVVIQKPDKSKIDLEVLATMPFTSDLKKMGIYVKDKKTNDYKVFLKGSPEVLKYLLQNNVHDEDFFEVEDFSSKGLRTLFFAGGKLNSEEIQHFDQYTNSVDCKRAKLTEKSTLLYSMYMPKLSLIGSTGMIDDIRQDAEEVIKDFKKAGIKTWLITGDTMETAKYYASISGFIDCRVRSYSVSKFGQSDELEVIDQTEVMESIEKLSQIYKSFIRKEKGQRLSNFGITGTSLKHIIENSEEKHRETLRYILKNAGCVIFSSMQPQQKKVAVELISDRRGKTEMFNFFPLSFRQRCIMAVGDGANDVPMMERADVAIFVSGSQDTNRDIQYNEIRIASDFHVPNLSSLRRLVLVHGIWNNNRIMKVALFSLYKNIVFNLLMFFYAIFCHGAPIDIFDKPERYIYNVVFTVLMPLGIGIFDRVHSDEEILKNPELYQSEDQKSYMNKNRLWKWTLCGIFHSFIIFVVSFYGFNYGSIWANGMLGDTFSYGTTCYVAIVLLVHFKIMLLETWTIPGPDIQLMPVFSMYVVTFFFGIISIIILFVYFALDSCTNMSSESSELSSWILLSPCFWLYLVLAIVFSLLLDFSYKTSAFLGWKRVTNLFN